MTHKVNYNCRVVLEMFAEAGKNYIEPGFYELNMADDFVAAGLGKWEVCNEDTDKPKVTLTPLGEREVFILSL